MNALVRPIPAATDSQRAMQVLVIGGGIGGLALAQGLRKSGINVDVYERDATPTDRLQGYRVHINPTGSRALDACLPPHLFDAFTRTCGRPSRGIRFLTERGDALLSAGMSDLGAASDDPVARHRSVSRITLRQVLLSGLNDVVHFGKAFTHYCETADGRVVAYFEDGTSAEGDILVAADGGGSRVRRQKLPRAERIDTGVVAIAGKVFLDGPMRAKIAPGLLDGMSLVSAKGGVALFVALQELGAVETDDAIGANDEAVSTSSHFDNTRSYLMWALGARREVFGLDEGSERADHETLRAIALNTMSTWNDCFKDLVRLADADTINPLTIRTSVPVSPWQAGRVTLLGDAIHSMTPYRGIGANVALKDASRLRDALVAAARGERDLFEAIGSYETAMTRYGFAAVETSRRAMEQFLTTSEIRRTLSRAAFRVIDRVPPLKRRMLGGMGEE
jgi:2-polyprenyl-6-methoxyphenol hydroxylase-like FAD-dependent oxidoreductase